MMKTIFVCICCGNIYSCIEETKEIKLCKNCDHKCSQDGIGDIEQSVCPTCIKDKDWGI